MLIYNTKQSVKRCIENNMQLNTDKTKEMIIIFWQETFGIITNHHK